MALNQFDDDPDFYTSDTEASFSGDYCVRRWIILEVPCVPISPPPKCKKVKCPQDRFDAIKIKITEKSSNIYFTEDIWTFNN